MWLPTMPAVLVDDSVDRTSLLIVQAWDELLSPFSPDSVQARALNLPLLLDDIAHVIGVAIEDNRWKLYLPILADELKEQREAETRILQRDHALDQAVLNVIVGIHHQVPLAKLRDRVLIARTLYGDPVAALVEDAKRIIAGGCVEKRELLQRLSALATLVQNSGLGDESVATLSGHHLRNDPEDVIDQIVEPLRAGEITYQCTVAVYGPEDGIYSLIEKSSFKRRGKKDQKGDETTRAWEASYSECFPVVIEIKAMSARHAAERALTTLTSRLNVHNLYLNDYRFRSEPVVLVYKADGTALAVEVTASDHFSTQPRRSTRELTNSRIHGLGERLDGRLGNALESNALALAAKDPRTALANFWTALETVTGPAGEGGIGLRVAKAIAPLVAWRKFDTALTYLSLSCHQHFKSMMIHVDEVHFPNSSNKFFSPDDVLSAVSGPSKNAKILALFKAAAPSPLLTFRLYATWRTYSDPLALKKKMDISRRRISWQIQRIYRARNLLVHQGRHHDLNWRLLQNAQSYVSTALGRVMHDLISHQDWTIDTSLEYHDLSFSNILERLDSSSVARLTHRDLLPWQTANPEQCVWPTPVV